MSGLGAEFADRLYRVRPRLATLAQTPPPSSLSDADPKTGERWDWGQTWAHIAEFPAYWIEQVRMVVSQPAGDPVPFGRVASDPDRIRAIEANRAIPPTELWDRLSGDLDRLRELIEDLGEDGWSRLGFHSTLGVMRISKVFDEFLVGHLESHAEQLEAMLRSPSE